MNFDYEEEKRKLKKKLAIFAIVSIVFTILFRIGMSDDIGFLSCLLTGLLTGLIFYIPGRIRDYFKLGWVMTIAISVAFVFAVVWLNGVIGAFAYIVLLFPLADMGYSIYRVVSVKKES